MTPPRRTPPRLHPSPPASAADRAAAAGEAAVIAVDKLRGSVNRRTRWLAAAVAAAVLAAGWAGWAGHEADRAAHRFARASCLATNTNRGTLAGLLERAQAAADASAPATPTPAQAEAIRSARAFYAAELERLRPLKCG